PVDRLLPIADDEDRRGERAGMREAGSFAPGLHEQRYQLPLGAACVLKFVNEDVVIARFETEAALRKLLHLSQEINRLEQHVREIEQGAGIECAPVFQFGDAKHPPDALRHQRVEVASPCLMGVENGVRMFDNQSLVDLPVDRRGEGRLLVLGWKQLARLSFVSQEMLAHLSTRLLAGRGIDLGAGTSARLEIPQLTEQQAKRRVQRSRVEEPIESAAH